jgi:hypothetical protein
MEERVARVPDIFLRFATHHICTRDGDSRSPSLQRCSFDHSDKDDAKYEAVTLEDVKRVAAKILAEDKFVISVVRPAN